MKKSMILLAAMLSGAIVSAQSRQDNAPYLVKSLSKEAIQQVLVRTEGGSILVVGTDQKEARIEVYIQNRLSPMTNEQIAADLKENYKFDVSAQGQKLNAVMDRKSGNLESDKRLVASFRIYVPGHVNTDLTTSGGGIRIQGLAGDQVLVTSGGDLNIDRVIGNIKGMTSGGNVLVTNSKQKIDVSTAGGSIMANSCDGTIGLTTSGGTINFENLNGVIKAATSGSNIMGDNIRGELSASTSGGNISLSQLSCSVDAVAGGGDVYAQFTNTGAKMRLTSTDGNLVIIIPKGIDADLDVSGKKINAEALQNFAGVRQEDKVNGKVNKGGAEINGFSDGNVDIRTL